MIRREILAPIAFSFLDLGADCWTWATEKDGWALHLFSKTVSLLFVLIGTALMVVFFLQPFLIEYEVRERAKFATTMRDRVAKTKVRFRGMRWMKAGTIYNFLLPNGNIGRWEALDCGEGVGDAIIVALTPAGKMVLVRQWRFPVEHFSVELPGGLIDGTHETPEAAARRELLEETGYQARGLVFPLNEFWAWNTKANSRTKVYLAQDCVKVAEPKLDQVEQVAQLTVIEMEPSAVISQIGYAHATSEFRDPTLAQAMIALIAWGIIKIS